VAPKIVPAVTGTPGVQPMSLSLNQNVIAMGPNHEKWPNQVLSGKIGTNTNHVPPGVIPKRTLLNHLQNGKWSNFDFAQPSPDPGPVSILMNPTHFWPGNPGIPGYLIDKT